LGLYFGEKRCLLRVKVFKIQIQKSQFVFLADTKKSIGNLQDVFATASTPMSILDAKYEKANIDASINSL
jgi:hypothetical protein